MTEWTSWFNIDHPGGNGDYERLEAIRFYYRERVCPRPISMEARTTDWVSAADTGEVVHSSLDKGFWCINKEQPYGRTCSNYHVRFQCPPGSSRMADLSLIILSINIHICLYEMTFACFVYLSLCSAQSYWSEWGEWGPCSTTLCNDVGIQVRHRTCVNSQPMPLLLVPACQGHPSERRECSTPACTGENTNRCNTF